MIAIYGQDKLTADARTAALAAAAETLSSRGVSADAAMKAASVDLLLAEGIEPGERTDDHYREHGASLTALDAYHAARAAAEAEIARLDPDNAAFRVMFIADA
ncbi:hypothetical protein [Sphingopyxis macrogoltabida]|uniref:Uncharacterized protein n=1 Tax=Sphingopyxis macrogoltabida TaxID=33050 RepID=A0AAC9AVE8_SPHMC|nr:hypothetical protein [Sphingopyxis macrogoltabida]ALJ12537.1 hypothetical protein LH19_06630 [Sphingopyxis macrogoltabida]AMU89987.1 hypothetical protein ATM17_13165 [Sphingopyxis macrogoltabida]